MPQNRSKVIKSTLRITEIYASIQGESSFAGFPCTFVRLTGCPLRCRWCDTAYAFEGGEDMTIPQIVDRVRELGIDLVEITGGEPLAQPLCNDLASSLIEAGFRVLIETSGSEPVDKLPIPVHIIMDIKCPGSGMDEKNLWSNLAHLKPTDEIKFVLANRADYDWAAAKVREFDLDSRFSVLMSVAFGLLKPVELAEWMTADRSPARLQLQQHKYIWHPRAKGV